MIFCQFSRLSLAIGLSLASSLTFAGAQTFNTARSLAMGGTGVAAAHPASANSANPAMLAADHHDWSDDFGLILPSVNARFADEEETGDQIDAIQDTIDRFQGIDKTSSPQEARDAAGDLRRQLNAFDKDTVRVDAAVGLSVALPSKTLAVGVFANASLRATARGDFDQDDEQYLADLETATAAELLLADLDRDLESRGRLLATAVSEFGISFARAFALANGNRLQLGVSPKYVQLRTFQYTETVSGFEDNDVDRDEYETDKSSFNFDLGAVYSFGETRQWNAGVVVKNMIPMALDSAASRPQLGEQIRTYELDPRVTVGIAHTGEFHTVTADWDLTKTKAFGFEDDTRWVAIGAEFDAFRYAQLRLGARHNLSSNDSSNGIEESTQLTFGIGLSPFGARLDIAGLVSDTDTGAAIELGAAF
ncbi:conjugal transfer protein TraF [Marinobacter caseinilyticus]|uniref:conjugal transfer protein TraF n=1 Tax=Marinobacter caseinilyticus TaxID=2692195 RepID=UPI00140AAE0D|nr:conjugal transfer protein TraF [Marinobacter caseinilyticus]